MQTEKILNTAYSFGAAVVVFAAWAKLENKDYASTALTIGLLTETMIFIIYGLMEWRQHASPSGGKQPSRSMQPPVKHREDTSLPKDNTIENNATVTELTTTMKQTNRILHRIFRID